MTRMKELVSFFMLFAFGLEATAFPQVRSLAATERARVLPDRRSIHQSAARPEPKPLARGATAARPALSESPSPALRIPEDPARIELNTWAREAGEALWEPSSDGSSVVHRLGWAESQPYS